MQKNKRGKKQMKEDNRSRDQKVAQLREKISSRIYREKEPRFKLANTIVLWMQLLLEFGMLLNMGYLGVTGNSRVMVGITIAWIVLGQIVSFVLYFQNPRSLTLNHIMIIQFGVAYTLTLFLNGNNCTVFLALPVFVATLMYNNRRQMNIVSIICGIVCTARIAMIGMEVLPSSNSMNEEVIVYLTMIASLISITQATRISWRFNHDAMHSMVDEQQIQGIIMEDVLAIAKGVRDKTGDADVMIEQLYDSAQNINKIVGEITCGTQSTSENIQNQTIMTQNIQESIQDAAARTKNAAGKATESMETVKESLQTMDELSEHSGHIADTNSKVVSSMEKLQKKTEDVKAITDMILEISSQTNLLALNASIEAARAGEAGKGFAVVAEQIRQLAEQTKQSTENITAIVEELSSYSEEASESIQESLHVTEEQTTLIGNASEDFGKINTNMQELTDEMMNINSMMEDLKESNNAIVDSISQLSAASHQIAASAEEASEITGSNQTSSKQARDMLEQVLGYSHQLDKYMK